MQFAPNFYIKKSFFYFFWPIQKSFFWLLQKILWLQPNIWYYLKRKHAIGFYKQNAHRVDAAMNMLADKKSKDIYLGVIRFIQTQNIRDYAFYPVEEDQYFFKKLRFNTNEVFIDCGAYTGDTIDCFLRHCNKYKQIIAFEPDLKNFEELKKNHGSNSKITLLNFGAYDKNGKVEFVETLNGVTNKIVENEQNNPTYSIQTKTIDSLNLKKITFIKMDIEGSELNALKGAKKTILRDKPKLAICIYHSNEDMIRIAEYIHSIVPEYKLYVRQYKLIYETVLYAIMP